MWLTKRIKKLLDAMTATAVSQRASEMQRRNIMLTQDKRSIEQHEDRMELSAKTDEKRIGLVESDIKRNQIERKIDSNRAQTFRDNILAEETRHHAALEKSTKDFFDGVYHVIANAAERMS